MTLCSMRYALCELRPIALFVAILTQLLLAFMLIHLLLALLMCPRH